MDRAASAISSTTFSKTFWSAPWRVPAERGNDLQYNLEITFEESVFGKKPKDVLAGETCADCKGTGAKSATAIKMCPPVKRQGQGQMFPNKDSSASAARAVSAKASGQSSPNRARSVVDVSASVRERMLSVNIPGGIETGMPRGSPTKGAWAAR